MNRELTEESLALFKLWKLCTRGVQQHNPAQDAKGASWKLIRSELQANRGTVVPQIPNSGMNRGLTEEALALLKFLNPQVLGSQQEEPCPEC